MTRLPHQDEGNVEILWSPFVAKISGFFYFLMAVGGAIVLLIVPETWMHISIRPPYANIRIPIYVTLSGRRLRIIGIRTTCLPTGPRRRERLLCRLSLIESLVHRHSDKHQWQIIEHPFLSIFRPN